MAGLKTCECGEPTYSDQCALCSTDRGLFTPPKSERKTMSNDKERPLPDPDIVVDDAGSAWGFKNNQHAAGQYFWNAAQMRSAIEQGHDEACEKLQKEIDIITADRDDWRAAYTGLRAFAESKGLDVVAHDAGVEDTSRVAEWRMEVDLGGTYLGYKEWLKEK